MNSSTMGYGAKAGSFRKAIDMYVIQTGSGEGQVADIRVPLAKV